MTVRGVCRQSGVSARYFYESFSDRDDFVGAVYDWVIADLAATTQAAVTAAPPREQARAGMANIVRSIAGDARVGRLLFSAELADSVVVRKRDESTTLLAMLSGTARRPGPAGPARTSTPTRPLISPSEAWGRQSARG